MSYTSGVASLLAQARAGVGAYSATYQPPRAPSLSTGALPMPKGGMTSLMASGAPKARDKGTPGEWDISLPFSTRDPAQAQAAAFARVSPTARQGDALAAIGAAIRNVASEVNLGNVGPWVAERPFALAQEAGIKTPGGIDLNPLDWAQNAAKAANLPVDLNPLDIPAELSNWYRDSELGDRAKVYRAIVSGGTIHDPMLTGNLFGVLGGGDSARADAAKLDMIRHGDQLPAFLRAIRGAADPFGKLTPDQEVQILAAAVDLPQGVKDAIARDPKITDQEINRLLDDPKVNPAGRQFTYKTGLAGTVGNLVPGLVIQGAPMIGAFGLKATAATGALGPVAENVAQAFSLAGRIGTGALKLGIGTLGVTLVGDAIAQYQGNQAAQSFFENAYKIHPVSDIPSVQLAFSLGVNPLEAVGAMKRGIIGTVHGADIVVGKVTGGRLASVFAKPDPTIAILADAYRSSPQWVQEHLIGPGNPYPTLGDAQAAVLNMATENVIRRLPPEEQATLGLANAGDWEAMHAAVLQKYGNRVADELTKNPQGVAKTIYDTAWTYHRYAGPFDREIARVNLADYQSAQTAWADLRHQYDAVPTYTTLVSPDARSAIREQLDEQYPNPTDTVPLSFLNAAIEKNPGLRGLWQDVAQGTTLTRAGMDEILDRSERAWNQALGRDPRATLTGRPTVLEPGYSERDLAEALGTDVGTIQDLLGNSAMDSPRVRAFVETKLGLPHDAVMAMTPQEIYNRAVDYVDTTTKPWIELGEQIAKQRERLPELQRQMANAAVLGDEELRARIEQEYTRIRQMLHDAGDPQTPYAATLQGATRRARVGRWADVVTARAAARETLDQLNAIDDAAAAMNHISPGNILDMLRPTHDGGYGWAGGTAPVTPALYERLRKFLVETGRPELAKSIAEEGDAKLWERIRDAFHSPQFVRGMNGRTKAYIQQNIGAAGDTLDDFSGAYSRATGQDISAETFLEQLANLKMQRDQLLGGKRVVDLRRTADAALPKAAEAELAFNVDPEWELHTHPQNVAELRGLLADATPDGAAIRSALDADPLLSGQAWTLARQRGTTLDALVRDNPAALREILPAEDVAPPVGELDEAIQTNNAQAIRDIISERGSLLGTAQRPRPPIPDVPMETAQALAKQLRTRLSNKLRREFLDAGGDLSDPPSPTILHQPQNAQARQVLSLLNHGILDTEPATLDGLLALQHEIEIGNATNMGIGLAMQADAQRLIRDLMAKATNDAKVRATGAGYFAAGLHPALLAEDDLNLAKKIIAGQIDGVSVAWGPGREDLAYGLGRRPKNAVVLEFQNIPGLAEEFMAGHFAPLSERLGIAKARQAFNYLFGPRSNQAITDEAYAAFQKRAIQAGIDPAAAAAVWKGWQRAATESHGALGTDVPLYARPGNIPTDELNRLADASLAEYLGLSFDRAAGKITRGDPLARKQFEAARSTLGGGRFDWARTFREASSPVMRALSDSGLPLADAIEGAYGKLTQNVVVTTLYPLFRFGMDVRFHAMNYFENYFLYGGKAALAPGSLDRELFGWTKARFTQLGNEVAADTGYPVARARDVMAQRAFVKLQGGKLTTAMKGLQSEDPALLQDALTEMAETYPELAALIRANGDDAVGWLKALDTYYEKVTTAQRLDESISDAVWSHPDVQATPALNEVWSRLDEVNRNLWDDMRQTFFGNPDRSRVERVLNSYLIMWPISYQIKAVTKWLLPLLFDNIGGLKTNALGAYTLDQVMAIHHQHLANDPKYRDFLEQNHEVLFLAEQMLPIGASIGITLSPPVRDIVFGATKNVGAVGPVYTLSTALPGAAGELYQDLAAVPGLGDALGVTTRLLGRKPKAAATRPTGAPSGVDLLHARYGTANSEGF
jgi:hypothetical protein